MALKRVNAVIVGAGAGGGVVAKELASAGLSVVVLERGKWYVRGRLPQGRSPQPAHHRPRQRFGPDDEGNPARRRWTSRAASASSSPADGGYSNNAACVGGGTFSYGAMAWRFMEKDFRMRSTYGAVAGSTLEDWPITYEDLEPYYEKAEWEIGVSGDDSANPFKAPRRQAAAHAAAPAQPRAPDLQPAAERLGLHPFDIPMLRNSVPYNGRARLHALPLVRRICLRGERQVRHAQHRHSHGAGHRQLRTAHRRAWSRRSCSTTAAAPPASLTSMRRAGCRQQTADLVIVCGARHRIRAPAAQFQSTACFRNGLGNRYDWVGRNLQGHTYTGAIGLFEEDVYDDLGPGAGIAICDYNHGNPGLAGGAMLANEFIRLPIQFLGQCRPGMPRWGKAHKDACATPTGAPSWCKGPVQEMPHVRIRASRSIPRCRTAGAFRWRASPARSIRTRSRSAGYIAGKAEAWLKEAGAVQTWKKLPGHGLSGGQHQAGTCRMGNDPKTSVVDRYCRVHDVDNVYVIDGSVHVTNGGFNPVLTIMANAYRASDHLLKSWKGTRCAHEAALALLRPAR